MGQASEDVWMLVFDPDLTMPERASTAATIWQAHGEEAVVEAAVLSKLLVARVNGSPAADQFTPAPPDLGRLFGLLGDDAAKRAWWIISGPGDDRDPLRRDELAELSRLYEDAAVFACAWWAILAVSTLAKHDAAHFTAHTTAVRNHPRFA